jgi:hypothetical protein
MSTENTISIPRLLQKKRSIIRRFSLDTGTWITLENGMVEQCIVSHPSYALQFPFGVLALLERQKQDSTENFRCPSCSDISPGNRSRIVEHVMETHVTLNVNKFLERLLWLNQDGELIKEKFHLTDEQLRSIQDLGDAVRRMDGLLAVAHDALLHSQKAKIILGTEFLDMVATQARQQALFDIIKNGLSEADALRQARADCGEYKLLHPRCTFFTSHLSSMMVRKSPKGGASPVKMDVYIEGINAETGSTMYTEVREVRAKAIEKGSATPVAEMLCGEASAVLHAKGMLSKFVVTCDMAVPFWKHVANHMLVSSFRVLRLGRTWQSGMDINRRHQNGYATTLADGMHVWVGFSKRNGSSYSAQIETWSPTASPRSSQAPPDHAATFVLELRQASKTVDQYNALSEQVVTVMCALCGVRRDVNASLIGNWRPLMRQHPWWPEYEAFERHYGVVSCGQAFPSIKESPGEKHIGQFPSRLAGAKREAIRLQNLRARLLSNQWTFKLVLRLWADGISYMGITSTVARQEVVDAFHVNRVDPRTAISHLTSTQARNILATLQNMHNGCRTSIMQTIISLL